MNTRRQHNDVKMRRAKRVRAHISGTAEVPRLNVARSNKACFAQLIDDVAGRTLVSVSVKEIKEKKLTKSQVAEKMGALIAEKASAAGISRAKFDRGERQYHGRVKMFAEGARKAGLKI